MTATRSISPAKLRKLKAAMEEDFARLLCCLTDGEDDASSVYDGWREEMPSQTDELDTALENQAQARLAEITVALRRFEIDTSGYAVQEVQPMSDESSIPQDRTRRGYVVIDRDDEVDVTSYDSFPASDPPSWIATGTGALKADDTRRPDVPGNSLSRASGQD